MKSEDKFYWHIYICFHLCKRQYYSFIRWRQFENFVFVMSAWTDAQYYSSSFFYTSALPIGKHYSPLPAQPGPLEKSPLICRPAPARWKNRLSFAGQARLIGKIISHLPARPGPAPGQGPVHWKNYLSSACPARSGPRARPGLEQTSNAYRENVIN